VSAVAVAIGHQSTGRRRLRAVPETADPVVNRGPGYPLTLDRARRMGLAIDVRTVVRLTAPVLEDRE
jgi:hypothetical protein